MKKIKFYTYLLLFTVVATTTISCEKQLEDEVFDSLVPSTFFQNDDEALSAAYAVYSNMSGSGWNYYGTGTERIQLLHDATTDVFTTTASGGYFWELNELILKPESGSIQANWDAPYRGIAVSNYILQFLPDASKVSDAVKKNVLAEAKVGLGLFYKDLVELFGDVPLIKNYEQGLTELPTRAPKDEVLAYAIQMLEEAIPDLPSSYPQNQYGRFTKAAAHGLLMKIHLLNKNWSKVDEYASLIINSSTPSFSLNPNYSDLFAVDNTNESEFILVHGKFPDWVIGNTYPTYSLPGDFPDAQVQQWNLYRVRREFYNTFDTEDVRRSLILSEYTNSNGDLVVLEPTEGLISVKYALDPAGLVVFQGNDTPLIRLPDVILAKAEALNELNGPNQTSIDLINMVRDRAFNNNPVKRVALQDFASKDELNAHILDERGWELVFEGHRRNDLIRHGEFINKAIERGSTVTDSSRILFAVPTGAIDSNPNLLPNNPGY